MKLFDAFFRKTCHFCKRKSFNLKKYKAVQVVYVCDSCKAHTRLRTERQINPFIMKKSG